MEKFTGLILPAALLALTLRLLVKPLKWFWRLGLHVVCGFLCLWLLNAAAPFTDVYFPLNLVTVLVAGILGLPGIVLLAVIQIVL